MAAFDREDDATRNRTVGIPTRSTNTPAWIAGIVVLVVVVLGGYTYETGMWGTHDSVAPAATHETTTTPPMSPAPSPAAKP
jgi:hypothetical protein